MIEAGDGILDGQRPRGPDTWSRALQPSGNRPAPKRAHPRCPRHLTTTSIDGQRETAATLVGLGGRHIDIGQSPDERHVVLADPEGNEFCLIEPGNDFLAGCGRLGAINCDGTCTTGYFWSGALGWPLVWDQDDETALRAPDGAGPLITWSGPPLIPKIGRTDSISTSLRPATSISEA